MIDKSWAYTVNRASDVSTVALSGEIDISAREELREVLATEVHRSGIRCVRVDLAEVGFLDSVGISTLVAAYLDAQEVGCQLTVTRAHDAARRVLEVTGVMPLLETGTGSAPAAEPTT